MARYNQRTCLIVVDVQNDFASRKGSLYVGGAEDIIPFINEQIEAATTAGAFVVYTQDWHPPDTPHFEKDGGAWPAHCVRNTRGAAFHPDLIVQGEVIRKGAHGEDGYSGFTVRNPETRATTMTPLRDMLRDRGITSVVVVGLATDYCVKETARDAARLGFKTTVLLDGVRAVNRQYRDAQRAFASMRSGGVVIEG